MFLDSGTCFGFWRSVFGFWDVFWTLGRVLDSGKCFVLSLQAKCQHTGRFFFVFCSKKLCVFLYRF